MIPAVPVIFLMVSTASLLIQSQTALAILSELRFPGLVRTSLCRVAVALLYVALGTVALYTTLADTGKLALSVFSITQVVWIVNGLLDKRLARRARTSYGPGLPLQRSE